MPKLDTCPSKALAPLPVSYRQVDVAAGIACPLCGAETAFDDDLELQDHCEHLALIYLFDSNEFMFVAPWARLLILGISGARRACLDVSGSSTLAHPADCIAYALAEDGELAWHLICTDDGGTQCLYGYGG